MKLKKTQVVVCNHQRKRGTILMITKVRETVGVPDYQGNYGDNRRYYLLGKNISDESRMDESRKRLRAAL